MTGRVLGAVFMSAVVAPAVLIANVLATFLSWKLALIGDAAAVAAVVFLWRRTPHRPWPGTLALTVTGIASVALATMMVPIWRDHARHDARLARMAAALCAADLPNGASIASPCSGSITNTGNGNSCRYLVTAAVVAPSDEELVGHLHREGFAANSFDAVGDPVYDGKTYWRDGHHLRIALMSSWQEDGNDLRCT